VNQHQVIIVMGVMGSGKTTVGKLLARQLHGDFYDADDFHPEANREKMASGQPLTEADREPWLAVLGREIGRWLEGERPVVLACSALRAKYRSQLAVDERRVRFAHLTGDTALLRQRIAARKGHFMPLALLDSQLGTLEPPDDALTLDFSLTPERLVEQIAEDLASAFK